MAKRADTAETSIAMVVLVMNLDILLRLAFSPLIYLVAAAAMRLNLTRYPLRSAEQLAA